MNPDNWRQRLVPALVNALACSAGAGWLAFDLSGPKWVALAGVAGGAFGFLNRIFPRDTGRGGLTDRTTPNVPVPAGAKSSGSEAWS